MGIDYFGRLHLLFCLLDATRQIAHDAVCSACAEADESQLHVLRDCRFARQVWCRLVPPSILHVFCEAPEHVWICNNLLSKVVTGYDIPWNVLFVTTIWWLWKWRNLRIFSQEDPPRDQVYFLVNQAAGFLGAWRSLAGRMNCFARGQSYVGWDRPLLDWVRANSDGSVKGELQLASAGGVLRDSDGRWISDFGSNLGSCTVSAAELWGVYQALLMCWEKGFRCVEMEVDSTFVFVTSAEESFIDSSTA